MLLACRRHERLGLSRKTGPSPAAVDALFRRSHEMCELCGWHGEQIHHRKARHMGGTSDPEINALSNLVHWCHACHAMVESRRAKAYENGWLVHSWDTPREVPFVVAGRPLMLDDDGGYSAV